tara:strand:- start:1570 stop:1932 length:363 start_codon:yes stop_codon:yes gene_type:complete
MLTKLYRSIFCSKYRFIWFTFIGSIAFFILSAQVSIMGYQTYASALNTISTFITHYKLIFIILHVSIIVGFYLAWDYKMDRLKKDKNIPESRIKPFRNLKWVICGLFAVFSVYLFVIRGW